MLHFPNSEAGTKLDVWCHYGSLKMLKQKGVRPEGDYDVWFTQPPNRAESRRPGGPSAAVALMEAPRDTLRIMRQSLWDALREEIGKNPTTGMSAFAMALESKYDALTLIGFDATTPDAPHYHDNVKVPTGPQCSGEWRPGVHDMLKEKRMMAQAVDHGVFLGEEVETKLIWLGRPHLGT